MPSGRRGAGAARGGNGSSSGESGGGSSSPGGSGTGTVQNVGSLLERYALKEWDVPLKNIVITENSRQTNPTTVSEIVQSVKDKGWMPVSLPQIMYPTHDVGAVMTGELARTSEAMVIDGNHRISAAKEVFASEPEKMIRCTCYSNIPNAVTRRMVSDQCNGTSELASKRSTYDQLFFLSSVISSAKDARADGYRASVAPVKASDVQDLFYEAGIQPPSVNVLRQWIAIVTATTTPALEAMRLLQEKMPTESARITKALLYDKNVRDLQDKPRQQALVLHIYARWPKRAGEDANPKLGDLVLQAAATDAWMNGIGFIVPEQEWSDRLKTLVERYAFAKVGYYSNYVKPHQECTERELCGLEGRLPSHTRGLDEETITIMRAKPLSSIRRELETDPATKEKVAAFDTKYNEVKNRIMALALQVTPPAPATTALKRTGSEKTGTVTGDGDGDRPGNGNGNGKNPLARGCTVCKAPLTSRYVCDRCGIHHVGHCSNAKKLAKHESPDDRRCIDCYTSSHSRGQKRPATSAGDGGGEAGEKSSHNGGKGKGSAGKKARGTLTPPAGTIPLLPTTPSSSGDKIVRRGECARVHEVMPLSRGFRVEDLSSVNVKDKATLVFISPGVNEDLLKAGVDWKERLFKIMSTACDTSTMLDPKGTVIVQLPNPYFVHASRIYDSLKQPEMDLTLEDHGLVVEYASRGGGVKSTSKALHLSSGPDHLLIAHPNGTGFTCNKKVLPQDFEGKVAATRSHTPINPCAECVMTDVPYLGTQRVFHSNVARWAIRRFTKQGETVVTLSADKDGVIECALDLGRKVEAFVFSPEARSEVQKRVEAAWEKPWREGRFFRESSGTRPSFIAPGTLPRGISCASMPRGIRVLVEEKQAKIDNPSDEDRLDAVKAVARKTAKSMKWHIKLEDSTSVDEPTLHALDGQRYARQAPR